MSANTRIVPAFKVNHLTPSNFELEVYLVFWFFKDNNPIIQ